VSVSDRNQPTWGSGLWRRRATRRRALAVGGAAALLGAVACSSSKSSNNNTSGGNTSNSAAAPATVRPASASGAVPAAAVATGSPAAASVPQDNVRRGGTLKIRGNEPSNFDVTSNASAFVIEIGSPIFSSLLRIDPKKLPQQRAIIGDLAESWELSPDGLQYTFHLRKNVNWHDGKPFSSQDVVTTLQRAPKVHPAKDLFSVISSVTAPDANTAVIKLSQPASYMLALLSHVTSAIAPAAILSTNADSLKTSPIGTGPFKFVSWDHNVSVKLARNPQYFIQGAPYVDNLEYPLITVGDTAGEVNALRTGQIHISDQFLGISADDVKTLKSAVPSIQSWLTLSSVIEAFFLNDATPPFNNPQVRQALALVLDQKKLIEFGFNGNGAPCGYNLSAGMSDQQRQTAIPGFNGVSSDNISKAKALMQQAGLGSGVTVDFVRGQGTAADSQQNVFQDMFKDIGITLKPTVIKYPDEVVPALVGHKFQAGHAPWVFTVIHPTSYLSVNVTSGADNRNSYSNTTYDGLYDKLLKATTDAEEQQIAAQMEQILTTDFPWVPTNLFGGYMAAASTVKGFNGVGFIRDYYDHLYTWLSQ
jgi:peptide/nickel transport system substrate-binding protein